MIITSPTSLPIVFTRVTSISLQALAWFATARQVTELANTQFIFKITRLVDARQNEQDGYDFYKRVTSKLTISRGGGEAFDQAVDALGLSNTLTGTEYAERTAGLPVERIITIDELTEDIFAALKSECPQIIEDITLEVVLLDLKKHIIATKTWQFPFSAV